MRRILAIFRKSFLFPFTALLGAIPAEGAGATDDPSEEEQSPDNQAEDNPGEGGEDDQTQDSEGDKPVNMTQKQLDALINRKFREGVRKGKAQPSEKTKPDDQAEKMLQEANKRLIKGVVKEKAVEANLTAKGAKFALLALQSAGLDEYLNDDGVDEEAVADFLEQFAEENAELRAEKTPTGTGGAANPKRGKPQKTSVGERLAKSISQPIKSSFFSN